MLICLNWRVKLTDSCGARILFVECQAPDEIILQRLRQRETTPSVSDARETHFAFLKSRFSNHRIV